MNELINKDLEKYVDAMISKDNPMSLIGRGSGLSWLVIKVIASNFRLREEFRGLICDACTEVIAKAKKENNIFDADEDADWLENEVDILLSTWPVIGLFCCDAQDEGFTVGVLGVEIFPRRDVSEVLSDRPDLRDRYRAIMREIYKEIAIDLEPVLKNVGD